MHIINLSRLDMEDWKDPRTLVIYTTGEIQKETIDTILNRFPEISIYGLSSHHGVFTPEGFQRGCVGLLIEKDDNVDIRTIAIDLSGVRDVRTAISEHLIGILPNARPHYVVMHATMGCEERIIEGIHDIFTTDVPICGATAANDRFLHNAFVFHNNTVLRNGVILNLIYSKNIHCTIAPGGYLPTQKSGTITAVDGRTILTIDDRPAADVYNEWTDGMFDFYIRSGVPMPRSGALYPLGMPYPVNDQIRLWLAHPTCINPENKGISLYSEPGLNDPVILARANAETLIEKSGEIFQSMIHEIPREQIRAAFIMYCAGCASIVAENMPDVCKRIEEKIPGIPFIGCLSFGEQGHIREYQNDYHGNMMIVAIFITK